MITNLKQGDLWASADQTKFRIINIVDVDNHTWVYYRNEKTGQEYSCYKESFEQRFSPTPA